MIYGYARVSTKAQDLTYQLQRLRQAGCERIYHEKRSGKDTLDRPELAQLMSNLCSGDVMLATVSDRVARDPLDLLTILHRVRSVGAGLRLIDEPFIDTTSEMADVIIYLIGWAAGLHRKRILENTANGRKTARARGVKFGRKPKLGPQERRKIVEWRAKGEPCARIAKMFGVSESTIFRTSQKSVASCGSLVPGPNCHPNAAAQRNQREHG